MKTFYNNKDHFKNFGYCTREWLYVLQQFEATMDLAPISVLKLEVIYHVL